MKIRSLPGVALCVAMLAVVTAACGQAPSSSAAARPGRMPGYLDAEAVPDEARFLPPPPAPGSPLADADVEIFRATRTLENGRRWRQAAADARIDPASVVGDFGCALGVDLDLAQAPNLSRLLGRSRADLVPIVGEAKRRFHRARPFVTHKGPVCVGAGGLGPRSSYPSGHAATGWLYALVLAQVEPARSAQILARGRAYGESRVVCGVHYASDIDAGRAVSTALVDALSANSEFRSDVRAARAEIDAWRAAGANEPDGARCALEQSELTRPW
jgi:acid phosphatase (class A)